MRLKPEPKAPMKNKLTKLFLEFLESEQSSGICLILCTIASIIITNSYFGMDYSLSSA